ncbi:MAG: hypothetical protein NXI27_19685 [Alphaproteobacteria bacterium]|nr:hypothetical protein [Alphaproteobacteria bacterium]
MTWSRCETHLSRHRKFRFGYDEINVKSIIRPETSAFPADHPELIDKTLAHKARARMM